MNDADRNQCFFRPGLILGAGGFGSDVVSATSLETHRAFGCIPPGLLRCVVEFPSDPPRPPNHYFPNVPADAWRAIAFRPSELAMIGYPQGLVSSLVQTIVADKQYAWLEDVLPFSEIEKCIGRRESGSIPALTRFFLALQVFAGTWDGEPNWFRKLEDAMRKLSPQYFESAMLGAGVPVANLRSTPAVVAIVGGGSGGTSNGAMLPLGLAAREIAHRLGLAVEVHLHIAVGLYRPPDGLEAKKLALSATLSKDCASAMNDAGRVWSFPLGPDRALTHRGPFIDRSFRYEANEKMEHNYAGMLADVSTTLFNYFFNRAFFESERNWTNA